MHHTLSLTTEIDDDVLASIVAQVVAYNNGHAGPGNGCSLYVLLRNEEDEVEGGLLGATSRGWLFVDHLVVPAALRKQGIGSKIVNAAEQEAISRGCTNAWLNTFEFQARGFYEKLGYECFGELPHYPVGFSRYFMKKSLSGSKQ